LNENNKNYSKTYVLDEKFVVFFGDIKFASHKSNFTLYLVVNDFQKVEEKSKTHEVVNTSCFTLYLVIKFE